MYHLPMHSPEGGKCQGHGEEMILERKKKRGKDKDGEREKIWKDWERQGSRKKERERNVKRNEMRMKGEGKEGTIIGKRKLKL